MSLTSLSLEVIIHLYLIDFLSYCSWQEEVLLLSAHPQKKFNGLPSYIREKAWYFSSPKHEHTIRFHWQTVSAVCFLSVCPSACANILEPRL